MTIICFHFKIDLDEKDKQFFIKKKTSEEAIQKTEF